MRTTEINRLKTIFRQAVTLSCVGTALLFGASALRADDDAKASHHRRHQETVQKTDTSRKTSKAIPTRDDRGSQEIEGHAVGGADGSEYRVRTGSHIPEHYQRKGYATDSRDNLFIYDQNDVRFRSTDNVSDTLRTVPGVTVRGPR